MQIYFYTYIYFFATARIPVPLTFIEHNFEERNGVLGTSKGS